MVWYIVEARKKHSVFWLSLNNVLNSANLNFMQRKPRLSTVKTAEGKENTKRRTLYSWDIAFRRRLVKNSKRQSVFVNFTPAASPQSLKSMCAEIRKWRLRRRTNPKLNQIASFVNPILRGWITYYGSYHRSGLSSVLRQFNKILKAWAMRKYKRLKGHKTKAALFIGQIAQRQPQLFEHWKRGMTGAFA